MARLTQWLFANSATPCKKVAILKFRLRRLTVGLVNLNVVYTLDTSER